jgi:multiple sugar transport system permease protein
MSREPSRWRHVPALVISLIFLAPTLLMVSGSLRDPDRPPPRGIEIVPSPLSLDSYTAAFDLVDITRYTVNSLFVTGVTVPLAVIVGSWGAYGMVRLAPRWRTVMVVASLVALMVPITALMVPRFALFRALGLAGTYVPLMAPALLGMSPFYVLIYYRAFRRIPSELFDAARVEGARPLRTWWAVAMPLVRGATVAVAVLAFAVSWGNLLDPLVYLYDERMFTLPIGLKSLALLDPHNYPIMLAGAVAAALPVVVLFIAAQRYLFEEART